MATPFVMPHSNASLGSGRSRFSRCGRLLPIVLVLGWLTSCAQRHEPDPTQTNLSWLGSMYGFFVSQHGGRPPRNVAEFRKFVESRTTPEQLNRLRVEDVGELFISPRDGKPFKMVARSTLPPPVGGEPSPVAFYEEVGKDGRRALSFVGGGTQVLDEQALQALLSAN